MSHLCLLRHQTPLMSKYHNEIASRPYHCCFWHGRKLKVILLKEQTPTSKPRVSFFFGESSHFRAQWSVCMMNFFLSNRCRMPGFQAWWQNTLSQLWSGVFLSVVVSCWSRQWDGLYFAHPSDQALLPHHGLMSQYWRMNWCWKSGLFITGLKHSSSFSFSNAPTASGVQITWLGLFFWVRSVKGAAIVE